MTTKAKKRNRKGRARGPAKARKLRLKRKLAKAKRLAPLVLRPHYEVADRVRGEGTPSIRNVESSILGGDRECKAGASSCSKKVDTMVLWEHWQGGYWRQGKRHQCASHAEQLSARLRRAK